MCSAMGKSSGDFLLSRCLQEREKERLMMKRLFIALSNVCGSFHGCSNVNCNYKRVKRTTGCSLNDEKKGNPW